MAILFISALKDTLTVSVITRQPCDEDRLDYFHNALIFSWTGLPRIAGPSLTFDELQAWASVARW